MKQVIGYPFPMTARLLLAAALLVVVVAWVSPGQLAAALSTTDGRWVAAAAALVPVGVALQWARWRALLRSALPQVPEAAVWRSLLAGFGLGLVTPGRLGELGRGIALSGGRRAATVLAAADRLLSCTVTLLAGAVAAFLVLPGWWPAAVATVVGVAAAALACSRRARRFLPGADVLEAVPGRTWATCALASVLFNLVYFAQMYLLLRAGGRVPASAAMAIPLAFALKTLAPVSFMDLGVREGAAVIVLGGFGVGAAQALQASLVLFALNVLLPGSAGLLSLGGRCAPASPSDDPQPDWARRPAMSHVC